MDSRRTRPTITLTVQPHPSGDGRVHVTAWAIREGRYGSTAEITVNVDSDRVPSNAEDLCALLLPCLASVVYGT